jgi:prolyl-tRNA synthetase
VAPYQVHLVALPWKAVTDHDQNSIHPESLYQMLTEQNVECLFDERQESPGVKFNDADLIGIPIRLTLSERSVKKGGVEYKRRDQQEKTIIAIDKIIPAIKEEMKNLESQL